MPLPKRSSTSRPHAPSPLPSLTQPPTPRPPTQSNHTYCRIPRKGLCKAPYGFWACHQSRARQITPSKKNVSWGARPWGGQGLEGVFLFRTLQSHQKQHSFGAKSNTGEWAPPGPTSLNPKCPLKARSSQDGVTDPKDCFAARQAARLQEASLGDALGLARQTLQNFCLDASWCLFC